MQNVPIKSKLREDIKQRLLASEMLQGAIADKVGRTTAFNVKRALINDSSMLCLPHYVSVIKEVLGMHEDVEIVDIITNPKLLAE